MTDVTKRRLCRIAFGILLILSAVYIHAQEASDLERVRKEIQQLEAELKAREDREKSLLEQVEDTEREIGLQRKHLQALEEEKKDKERSIRKTEAELRKAIQSHQRLKEVVAKRLVSMYKRGRVADWEVLFTLSSLNQAMVWMRYQKLIVENDRRNLRLLKEKEETIQSRREKLANDLRTKEQLLQEETKAAKDLDGKRTSREGLLAAVRQDKKQLLEKLRQKQMAYEEIKGRIRRAEQQRKVAVEGLEGERFAALKGKLNWPVKGKVISKHGRIMDPELKTWTENLGIDIQAGDRDAVRSVYGGQVVEVYWMRGMGNVVLVTHGGGYYTVYGHLDVALVVVGDRVQDGEVIGYVGDGQGLNGSMLHFGVWNGSTHYNPEVWLRRTP